MKFPLFFLIILTHHEFISGRFPFHDACAQFSLNFFRSAYNLNPTKNCVLSPIAIQQMFAMLHHAANRNSTSPMHSLLGFPHAPGPQEPPLADLNNHALEMITKVFHSQAELNPNLMPVLQADYSVDVQVADFSRPQLVADSVNRWASRFTNGMVENVCNENDAFDGVNLMIVNTLTMNASWEHQFSPRSMQKGVFHFPRGDQKVDMMRGYEGLRYCGIEDLRVVEIAFARNTDLSMLIIKSNSQPLQSVIDRMDLETYREIDEKLHGGKFKLVFPKFSISTAIGAKRILKSMGLSDAFERNAFDVFVGFSSRLANVYQVLRIDIDEHGTQAAAGTYSDKSMRTEFRYEVDGPFVFVIRKDSTKDIIFIGHYSNDRQ